MRPWVAKKSFFRLVCVLLILVVIGQFYYHVDTEMLSEKSKEIAGQLYHYAEKYRLVEASWIKQMKPLPLNVSRNKIILLYTPYFRSMPWSQTTGNEMDLKLPSGQTCKVSSCFVSYSRQDFCRSDAVLFHAASHLMPWKKEMKELFSRKRKGQKWVFFSEENPIMADDTGLMPPPNRMIDITISYKHNSNIKSLYGYFIPNTENSQAEEVEKLLKENMFSSGKDRLVLWFASNCVTPRLDIVKAISKYIKVDVYGGCQKYFHNQTEQCGRYSQDCHQLAKRYKFYLAIENYQCRDYVTEKYWRNALSRNIVPIVVAGQYNKDIMIKGSYIDILDFPHAKALARYLHYLDSNDTAYNMYFQWKKNFTAVDHTSPTWLCDLCELLHQNISFQPWNMEQFWGIKQNCHADESYIINTWLTSKANRQSILHNRDFWTFLLTFVFLIIHIRLIV